MYKTECLFTGPRHLYFLSRELLMDTFCRFFFFEIEGKISLRDELKIQFPSLSFLLDFWVLIRMFLLMQNLSLLAL